MTTLTRVGERRSCGPGSPLLRAGPALTAALSLTGVVVALMLIQSVLGLAVDGLYPEDTWAVAALRGNDLVTLVLVVPALTLAVAFTHRRPTTAGVTAWLGLLFYGLYNCAYYSFGTAFNDVFLLHVAAFALSMIALVLAVASVDARQVAAGVAGRVRSRVVAAFTAVVGLALLAAWGGLSLRFALTGRLPADVMPASAVHLVYALDLSLLAPAFLISGVLLWRRTAWGAVMATAVNVFGAAYLTVLEVVGGFQADAGIGGKTWLSPTSIGAALLCLAAAAALLLPARANRRRAGEVSPGRRTIR